MTVLNFTVDKIKDIIIFFICVQYRVGKRPWSALTRQLSGRMHTQRYNNKNCTKRKSSDSDEPISPPQKKKKSRVLLPAVIEKGSEEEYARNIKVCRAEVLRGKNANEDMIKKLLEVKFETFEL
jgi:hypothetical protein